MLLLKDYDVKNSCFRKWRFAYEAEIQNADASDFNLMFGKTVVKYYTERIWEAEGVHNLKEEGIEKFVNFINKNYEYAIPWWADGYLSGGNHFHVFFDYETKKHYSNEYCDNMQNKKFDTMLDWLFYCPLYAKYYDGKWFNRKQRMSRMEYGYMPSGSKGCAVTLKDYYTGGTVSGTYSLEFRINQVTDPRIYGYYLGVMLLAEARSAPVKADTTAEKNKFTNLKNGFLNDFRSLGFQARLELLQGRNVGYENTTRLSVVDKLDIRDYPQCGFEVNEEIVKANIRTILETLENSGMVMAREGLVSYLEQYRIPH